MLNNFKNKYITRELSCVAILQMKKFSSTVNILK